MNKRKLNIPFSPPDISEKEIEYVKDTLESGWITTGPRVKEFEAKLAAFLNTQKVACLNSQTACAETALRLLGIGPGDEVITCAYTYTATASVIDHVGATIKLIDCQKDSPIMDYDALEKAITEKTKVIISVDLAGIPCDYDRIFSIVQRKRNLFCPSGNTAIGKRIQSELGRVAVLADAAHALGAEYKGKKIGTIADFTAFSFHAVKNLTTAEGGCLSWNAFPGVSDEEIYHKIQLYSLHGQSKDAFSKNQLASWEYDVEGLWYKCNMTDIQAAIGLAQLERYEELLSKRRDIVLKYDQTFIPLGVLVLPHLSSGSSCHLYLSRVPLKDVDCQPSGDQRRNEIIKKMAENGIGCNVHYKPLPLLTAYKNKQFDITDYPNAYSFYANEITLPLHTNLTREETDYIVDNYRNIVREYL